MKSSATLDVRAAVLVGDEGSRTAVIEQGGTLRGYPPFRLEGLLPGLMGSVNWD